MDTPADPTRLGPPWRVVVADDDASFRQLVRMLMEDDSTFEVVGEASDGQEAVDLASSLQPHCVILDMKMPVMDGDTALAMIKDSCPHTDVIALSGGPWTARVGPPPDAALEKGGGRWMEMLPVLVEMLATNRAVHSAN